VKRRMEGRGGKGRKGGEGMGGEGKGERTGGMKRVHNLRKTTPPRHQMAGYGPAACIVTDLSCAFIGVVQFSSDGIDARTLPPRNETGTGPINALSA